MSTAGGFGQVGRPALNAVGREDLIPPLLKI